MKNSYVAHAEAFSKRGKYIKTLTSELVEEILSSAKYTQDKLEALRIIDEFDLLPIGSQGYIPEALEPLANDYYGSGDIARFYPLITTLKEYDQKLIDKVFNFVKEEQILGAIV